MTGSTAPMLFGKLIKWLFVTTTICQSSKSQPLWFHFHKAGLLHVSQGSRGKGHWGYLVSVRGFTTEDRWPPDNSRPIGFWQDLFQCVLKFLMAVWQKRMKVEVQSWTQREMFNPVARVKLLHCTFLHDINVECQRFWTKNVSYQPHAYRNVQCHMLKADDWLGNKSTLLGDYKYQKALAQVIFPHQHSTISRFWGRVR